MCIVVFTSGCHCVSLFCILTFEGFSSPAERWGSGRLLRVSERRISVGIVFFSDGSFSHSAHPVPAGTPSRLKESSVVPTEAAVPCLLFLG